MPSAEPRTPCHGAQSSGINMSLLERKHHSAWHCMQSCVAPHAPQMLGGVGRPKLKRIALGVSGRPFAWLREAIRSNGQLPGNAITVVLERPAKGTGPCR